MKMNVYISDNKEIEFRKAVYERLGYKKGNLNKAFEQAIDLWLTNIEYLNNMNQNRRVAITKNKEIKTKTKKSERIEIADDNLALNDYDANNVFKNMTLKELYDEYKELKQNRDQGSLLKCGQLIRLMNKIIDSKNVKSPKSAKQFN